jgi:hypothetical protein
LFEVNDSRRIRYLLASYSSEWARDPWHSFSPVDVLLDGKLREQLDSELAKTQKESPIDATAGVLKAERESATEFAALQFCRYLRIRAKWDYQFDSAPNCADVHHSALLMWLLMGREPTPQPPPLLYSYPCHSLAAGEPVEVSVEMLRTCFEIA